ncbi:MAG: spore coat protein U domain-containing protein, partial [Lysobacter sp.]|nr:spore coat protein U domain-containing protein [Lysobacter sp.]
FVLALGVLCSLPFMGTAAAQNRGCVVEQAPPLDFGQPAANPTTNEMTSAAVRVRCTGNGSEGGATVRVCISLDPTLGQTTERQMRNGASVLRYQIRGNSPTGPVLAPNQTADGVMTLNQGTTSSPFGIVTIPLYGLIAAGQTGLPPGTYFEAIRGDVRSTTTPSTGCNPLVQATLTTFATAFLPGSCSIVADDMAFGSRSTLAGGVSAAAGIRLTCTSNTPWSVGIDGGSNGDPANRRMRRNGIGPESVGYGLYRDAGRSQPWGNTPATSVAGVGTGVQVALTAYGQVPGQALPLPGDYQDTVVVTVAF